VQNLHTTAIYKLLCFNLNISRKHVKPSLHIRFWHAFSALRGNFPLLTLVYINQGKAMQKTHAETGYVNTPLAGYIKGFFRLCFSG